MHQSPRKTQPHIDFIGSYQLKMTEQRPKDKAQDISISEDQEDGEKKEKEKKRTQQTEMKEGKPGLRSMETTTKMKDLFSEHQEKEGCVKQTSSTTVK